MNLKINLTELDLQMVIFLQQKCPM